MIQPYIFNPQTHQNNNRAVETRRLTHHENK